MDAPQDRQIRVSILVLQHYIGATPCRTRWAAMFRRLMDEFKWRLGPQQDIPDQPDALRKAFDGQEIVLASRQVDHPIPARWPRGSTEIKSKFLALFLK